VSKQLAILRFRRCSGWRTLSYQLSFFNPELTPLSQRPTMNAIRQTQALNKRELENAV
jgi:hypothetical protein